MVLSSITPITLVLGLLGYHPNLSLYGIETYDPISLIGILLHVLFAFKGVVAFGLWFEKKWAVQLAIIDAISGIIICIIVVIIMAFSNHHIISIRLEFIALIPFLIKMKKIKPEWTGEIKKINENDNRNEKNTEDEKIEEKVITYLNKKYETEDGEIIIEQELHRPNIGEKVFLNGQVAPNGRYKIGFMSNIEVENGVIIKTS